MQKLLSLRSSGAALRVIDVLSEWLTSTPRRNTENICGYQADRVNGCDDSRAASQDHKRLHPTSQLGGGVQAHFSGLPVGLSSETGITDLEANKNLYFEEAISVVKMRKQMAAAASFAPASHLRPESRLRITKDTVMKQSIRDKIVLR